MGIARYLMSIKRNSKSITFNDMNIDKKLIKTDSKYNSTIDSLDLNIIE